MEKDSSTLQRMNLINSFGESGSNKYLGINFL